MEVSISYKFWALGRTGNQFLLEELEDFQEATTRMKQIVQNFSEAKVKNSTEQNITRLDSTGVFICGDQNL